MKLLSIKLCNFRQFYGKTPEINLAHGERNSTIIHGNNGAGKTTILNAFTWALYERFTGAFASPELLVNKRALAEVKTGTSVECSVEIYFEHDGKRYQLKRKFFAYEDLTGKIQHGQNVFFMSHAGDDGNWYTPTQSAEDIINQILPESLHRYFFFDGEQIDYLFRKNHRESIAEDTKELIGIKVLDRSIEHLKKAKKTLQDELNSLGESDTSKLYKQESNLESELERINTKLEGIIAQIEQQEELKKLINEQLLKLSGAEDLKKLREKLLVQEKSLRQNLVNAKNRLKKLISSQSYRLFLVNINREFYRTIEPLKQKGELPRGLKKQFIEQLLEQKQCICGGELSLNSEGYNRVSRLLTGTGGADLEEAYSRLENSVIQIDDRIATIWGEIDSEQANITRWRTELSLIESELDEVNRKFRTYPDEDIKNLQNRLDTIESSLRELRLEQGANKHQREIYKKELESLQKTIQRQQQKQEKHDLTERQLGATQDAIERLTEVRQRVENQFRLSLEKRVQEIFSTISYTPYIPRINRDYEVRLLENTTGKAIPVAASTGENQILSLSFIGSIIDRVREWSRKNTFMGLDSSTFPIVMDSPFGSLDPIYRRQVARAVPRLANQLVVCATKTQWRGEVEEEMKDYIGKQYVLVYNSPKPDCQEDSITIDGVDYPLVRRSPDGSEYTEIVGVSAL